MKITIVLEDVETNPGKGLTAVSVDLKIDPKPGPNDSETNASLLADKLWRVIQQENKPAPSKIINRLGEPMAASQGRCGVCGKLFPKMFPKMFSLENEVCPTCSNADRG